MTMTVSQSSRRSERGSASGLAAPGSASVAGPWGEEEDMGQGKEENKHGSMRVALPGSVVHQGPRRGAL